MGEGRVYTHGTLSAVQRRSDRAGAAQGLPSTDHPPKVLERCLWKALERTAHASASLRVMMTRALLNPLPGRPCGPNVRCKKTYRATQRTNQVYAPVLYRDRFIFLHSGSTCSCLYIRYIWCAAPQSAPV